MSLLSKLLPINRDRRINEPTNHCRSTQGDVTPSCLFASSDPLTSPCLADISRQHGALLPAVPLGADTRHLFVPLPSLYYRSPSCPTWFSHAGPIFCPSLTYCPAVAPWLYLPYHLLPVPCPRLPPPLSSGPQGADRAPDYLCVAALCFVL